MMKKILFSLFFLVGCFSEKKLAEKCLQKFPNDTTEIVIIDTILSIDTIRSEKHDTAYLPSEIIFIDTSKTIKKTIYKTIKPTIELTMLNAKRFHDSVAMALIIQDQKNKIDELNNKAQLLNVRLKDANKYKLILYGILIIAFIFACVSIRKWFSP